MEHLPPIAGWDNFYVIVGSSGAALTGLQFVVMTLISERGTPRAPEVRAFGTPTVVHFCAVLLISSILSAPWQELSSAGTTLVACGVAGVAYALIIIRRARAKMQYKPVLEDWIWHAWLPLLAYSALLIAAAVLSRNARPSLFVIAGSAVLLLFVGIHNAWDTVAYLVMEREETPPAAKEPPK